MSEERVEETRAPHPVDEVLPAGRLAVLGFQHVLASIVAIVLNVVFNILGGGDEGPEPTRVATARTSGDTRGPV